MGRRRSYGGHQPLTWQSKRRVMELAAYRRFGEKHATAIIFGPYVGRVLFYVVVIGGLAAAWVYVPHVTLGLAALVLGGLSSLTFLVWRSSMAATQRRLRGRAAGASRGLGLGPAVAALSAMLFAVSWMALWSPWG